MKRDEPFLMPIEDVYSITGLGPVCTGQIERGRVRTGDPLDLVGLAPAGAAIRTIVVRRIEMYRRVPLSAEAGQTVALWIDGVDREGLRPGQRLAQPGSLAPSLSGTAELSCEPDQEQAFFEAIQSGEGFRIYLGERGVVPMEGTIEIVEQPRGRIRFRLERTFALESGLRMIVIVKDGPVGSGTVTDVS